jgi:hypothetical protein
LLAENCPLKRGNSRVWFYPRFYCTLPRGTYGYSVYATDAAGNTQSAVGSNTLTVK